MKYYLIIIASLLNINALAQDIEDTEVPKKEGHNFIMIGANWNWTPNVKNPDYYTEAESDIGMSLRYIMATKKNQAIRFTFGLKLGANQFYGDPYFQEDTAISPLLEHHFAGLYVGIGKEWQKRVQGNLVLFAGGDITFGASSVAFNYHLISDKRFKTDNFPAGPQQGNAYFGAIMPTAGIRYHFGRFAMSYAVVTPWQFQHTSYNNISNFQHYIRPKHALTFGYHFFSHLKQRNKKLEELELEN